VTNLDHALRTKLHVRLQLKAAHRNAATPVTVSTVPATGMVPKATSTRPLLALLINSASSGGDVMGWAALGEPGPTITCIEKCVHSSNSGSTIQVSDIIVAGWAALGEPGPTNTCNMTRTAEVAAAAVAGAGAVGAAQ
jgi:hypothetical protein